MTDDNQDLAMRIREWIASKPGCFISVDHTTVLRMAHASCGCGGTLEDFVVALKRIGYVPEPHRVGAGHGFILPIPGRSANDSVTPYNPKKWYSANREFIKAMHQRGKR